MSALLAINWEPELRGILIVIISVTVLCGSVYLILGTNMGARLGFLVSLAALAGWMFIMGAIWWSYGQGLKGTDPSWQPVASQSVIRDPGVLDDVGIIGSGYSPTDSNTENAVQIQGLMGENGWSKLGARTAGRSSTQRSPASSRPVLRRRCSWKSRAHSLLVSSPW